MHGKLSLVTILAISLTAPLLRLPAQTPAEWIARGERAFVARDAAAAVAAYDSAIAVDPDNYDALWGDARSRIDLAFAESDDARRAAMYKLAEERATHAVAVNPAGAEGHFVLAEALGRMALTLGARERVAYAGKVRDQALACLKIDPKHPGCLHVMGVWNAEVMRLSGITRLIARKFLGGDVFGKASWADARRYLEEAVTIDPRRIVHRLDLARVYQDMGLRSAATTEFKAVVSGQIIDYNDPVYKTQAEAALRKLQ
jgi:tetratricopeptide (TPR) repeat protein